MEMVRVGQWVILRRQELDLLYQVYSEEEHLVPGQQLAHAVPLPNTEWNYPLTLFKPDKISLNNVRSYFIFIPSIFPNKSIRVE